MYKVFVVSSKACYRGHTLIGAESEEDAEAFIAEYKASDPNNEGNSYGWSSTVYEIEELSSSIRGIVHDGIDYVGC
jgi:hypothetical protein